MEAVLDFIYLGQTTVTKDHLGSFLEWAEDLKIEGLHNSLDNGNDIESREEASDEADEKGDIRNILEPVVDVNNCLEYFPINVGVKKTKRVSCNACGITVASNKNLKRHIQALHHIKKDNERNKDTIDEEAEKKFYNCDQCDYNSVHKNNIRSHMLVHSDTRSYKCTYCEKATKRPHDLKKHVKRAHPVEFFQLYTQ